MYMYFTKFSHIKNIYNGLFLLQTKPKVGSFMAIANMVDISYFSLSCSNKIYIMPSVKYVKYCFTGGILFSITSRYIGSFALKDFIHYHHNPRSQVQA